MHVRPNVTGVVYHGYRRETFEQVIAVESASGERLGLLHHAVNHSPSGMNWGYLGSGPCDTARSLLIDALGADAICPLCQGTGRVVYTAEAGKYRVTPFDPVCHPWSKNGWPCGCSGGYRRLPEGQFVDDFVAGWENEWVISRATILEWLARAEETEPQ